MSIHKELHLGLESAELERIEEVVKNQLVFLRMPPDVACVGGICPTLARHVHATLTPQVQYLFHGQVVTQWVVFTEEE